MYPHQAERLSEALERARLDALVATSPANVAYLTGFSSPADAVFRTPRFGIFTRQGTALVLPAIEVPAVVADALDVDHVVCFGEFHAAFPDPPSAEARRIEAIVGAAATGPVEAVAAALERLGIRRGSIGLDENGLTAVAWTALADRLAPLEVAAGGCHLAAARRVKGPYEIECLGQALRIAEQALDVVIQTMERGMTEREAATLYSRDVIKRGGRPFSPVVAVGERSAIRAPWPTERPLRSGDFVRFDVGCVYKGYCSSVGRTAVLGVVTARQEAAYRAVRAGLERAVGAVTPGMPAFRVFDACIDAVRADGLPGYERGRIGHGIGLEPREQPELASGEKTPLEVGEVLCVEAASYEIGSMGIGAKDTVLVTSAGGRTLNRSHHDLVVLD